MNDISLLQTDNSSLSNPVVSFEYVVLLPLLPGTSWLLVGELTKFVTLSAQRFTSVSYSK